MIYVYGVILVYLFFVLISVFVELMDFGVERSTNLHEDDANHRWNSNTGYFESIKKDKA